MDIEKDFDTLYQQHSDKVYRLCLGYASGNNEIAQEWHQQTFIKIWNHRKSFQQRSSISTWIYRIAVNTCLSDLRKTKKTVPLKEVLMEDFKDIDENKDQNIQKMYACIDQLNHQNKTLILLELEEIPQETIAHTVGLQHGTLRTRLSRIRKSLLKCITNGK